jgi:hypothetical protein
MSSACVIEGCTRAGTACKECGKALPPAVRRGGRRREYCSAQCCKRARNRLRGCSSKIDAKCRTCGVSVPQPPGRGRCRRYCSGRCARRSKCQRRSVVCQCSKCGRPFSGYAGKMFCSPKCRYGVLLSDPFPCKECGSEFVRDRHSRRHCSQECSQRSRERCIAKNAMRSRLNAINLQCLCCCRYFRKKHSGRNVGKYCSRECAFEARRLKLPCASLTRRQGSPLYGQLAVWFHSWGTDDLEPKNIGHRRGGHKYRCQFYGCHYESFPVKSIFVRDNWTCQICRCALLKKFTRFANGVVAHNSPSLDHIIPLSLGPVSPGHCPSNVQAACWKCNVAKGNRHPDSFAPR